MAMNLGMGAPGMPAGITRFTRPITPAGQAPLVQPGQGDGPRMVQAQSVPGGPMPAMPLGMGVDVSRTVMGRREAPQGAPMEVTPIASAEAPPAPVQPQPMAPPAAPGGLGGLGGFFGQDGGFGDTLSALGRSMMSSPNGWWTRGYGENMDAIEQRRMQERARASQAQAMERALMELGFSPDEARTSAGTPEAAQIVMQAREQARQREEQAAARARADAMMRGMPAQPAAPAQGAPPPLGSPEALGLPPDAFGAQPAPAGEPAPAAPPAADPYAEIRARDEGIARLEAAAAAYEQAGDPVTAATLKAQAEARKRDRDLLVSRLPPVEGPGDTFRDMTPEEVAAAGLAPGLYQRDGRGRVYRVGNEGVVVNNNMPGASSELRDKLDNKTGELWATFLDAGAKAGAMDQDMQFLAELIEQAPQGPLQGRLAQALPGFDNAGAAFQSIVSRLAPQMRAEGSGATSDVEYQGFLNSLPSLRNNPEANRAIVGMIRAKAAINMERANVIQEFQNGDITERQAREQIAELNSRSIMTPELRALMSGMQEGGAGAPVPPPSGQPGSFRYNPETGDLEPE